MSDQEDNEINDDDLDQVGNVDDEPENEPDLDADADDADEKIVENADDDEDKQDANKNESDETEGDGEKDIDDLDDIDRVTDLPINEDILAEGLQLLCKTGNGLSHAYVRLDASQKALTDIKLLKNYIHLRYIDLSNNNLKDISPLNVLTHLLTLKLDFNRLTSAKLDPLPYLQQASFSNNRIKNTDGICHPKLEVLNLNKNEISDLKHLHSDNLPNLQTLELRENRLTTTKGMRLPTLKNLFMAANMITSLENLSEMVSLNALHLRDNKLEKLDGFSEQMNFLQYINLRGNMIADYKEVKKLQVLPKLKAIVLLDTPLSDNSDYRLEVLISVRRLERLDKDEYATEERSEAEDVYEQRRLKEQEEALANDGSDPNASGNKAIEEVDQENED